jgi:tetratricopeptide (TPR) repeat protein
LLGLKRDYENAESLFRRAIEGREKVLGLDDPETLKSKQDLGWMFHRKGDIAAAEPFFRGALPGLERSLGVDHRDTLACAHNLALVLEHKGELDEAEKLWQRAVVGSLKQLGAIHRTTVLYVNSLGSLLLKKGDKEKALKLQLDSVLEREKEPESGGDKQLPIDLNNLGLEFRKVGKLDVAEQLLRRALAKDQAIRGQSHPKIPHRLNNLCSALIMQGKLNEAKPLLARAWQMKSGKHDLTSTRLLFVRLTVALLESQSSEQILGMLKTMVAWESMPDHAEVVTTWDMAYFIEYLRPKLPLGSAEFLTALAAALNDHDEVGKLDSFDLWKNSSPIPLDIPWPE